MIRVLSRVLALCCVLTLPAAAQEFAGLVDTADAAVGRVVVQVPGGGQGSGTGFVIGEAPGDNTYYLVTNHHVVDGRQTGPNNLFVGFLMEGKVVIYRAAVLKESSAYDLALLQISQPSDTTHQPNLMAISNGEVDKNEPVAAIGFPGSANAINRDNRMDRMAPAFFESTFTQGAISRVYTGAWTGETQQIEIVQHTAPINGGNSGGPLINRCGSVVGVNTAGAVFDEQGRPQSGTFWASSGPTILSFLAGTQAAFRTSGNCAPGTIVGIPYWVIGVAGALVVIGTGTFVMRSRRQLVPAGGVAVPSGRGEPRKRSRSAGSSSSTKILYISAPGAGSGPRGFTSEQLRKGVTIGRSSTADVTVNDDSLSRMHAKLSMSDRKLMVQDVGSSNGSSVDGQALTPNQPQQINTSSKIILGAVQLQLERQKGR